VSHFLFESLNHLQPILALDSNLVVGVLSGLNNLDFICLVFHSFLKHVDLHQKFFTVNLASTAGGAEESFDLSLSLLEIFGDLV
jgi:hypothetical protein